MQQVPVDESKVLAAYKARTPTSRRLHQEARGVAPGGVMAGIKFFPPYPIFMNRASGSHIWDVDGNEYVDYLMSYGALILGHGDLVVREALDFVLRKVGTTVTGTPSVVEVEYGRLLRDMFNRNGMIRFTNSGLEATLLAVRLARAYTGRRMVGKFEGHFHGANEQLLVSYMPSIRDAGEEEAPKPASDSAELGRETLSESLVLPFNDWPATQSLIENHADRLACVILEPFEEGVIPGERSFMRNLRRLTSDLGVPLIYDEVKTGLRVRMGGASEFYSVTPDLTCLGKIIGGGVPIGALVGTKEMMSLLDPETTGKKVFHSGTFNGNPLSLHMGKATVEALGRSGNFDKIVRRTDSLKSSLADALSSHQIPCQVVGEGAMFGLYMTDSEVRNYRDVQNSDIRFRRHLDMSLICKGVYLKPASRLCLSLAHSDEDVAFTGRKFEESLRDLAPQRRG